MNTWLVRAGNGNDQIDFFIDKSCVAIGWPNVGSLEKFSSKDELKKAYHRFWPNDLPGKVNNAVGMLWRFLNELKRGDIVTTYNQTDRIYSLGEITGDYTFDPKTNPGYPHIRKVKWQKTVPRDLLSAPARNTLGSVLTLFRIDADTAIDLQDASATKSDPIEQINDAAEEQIVEDTINKAFELTKDKISRLDEHTVPELIAAVLRAMGFKTRVSPPGPDRGVDVLASPDGFGLVEPRIKVEVKHRPGQKMGSREIRSFLGGFRQGDRGLYVSTGGFTKDANMEADRAQYPLTLVDLDELTRMVVNHYERFDAEGRRLLNLVRIYWPQ